MNPLSSVTDKPILPPVPPTSQRVRTGVPAMDTIINCARCIEPKPRELTKDLLNSLFSQLSHDLKLSMEIVDAITCQGRKSYKNYMDFIRGKIKEGKDITNMSLSHRVNFFEANKAIMGDVCGQYIRPGQEILEVGAGSLTNDLSYLATLLPEPYQKKVVYSDCNPTHKYTRDSQIAYIEGGIVEVCDTIAENSIEHMMSCMVFDTLSSEDAEKCCEKAFRVIQPGGTFIAVMDILPFTNTLFSACNNGKNILFPSIGPDTVCDAVLTLDQEYLKEFLETPQGKNLPSETYKFFQDLLKASPLVREHFAVNLKNQSYAYVFTKYVKTLFGSALKSHCHWEYYEKKMEKALLNAGFMIKEFGLRRNLICTPAVIQQPYKVNYYINVYGRAISTQVFCLTPNTKLCDNSIHVIVAKKT